MKNSNIKDVYSLTPAQEGMFAQCFRNDEAKTYHLQSLSKISKAVDLTLLEKSVGLLSLRHPVLKTAFTILKSTGAIKQVILENRRPDFTSLVLDKPFSEEVLDKIICRERKKIFDLQKDSLFRVTVADFQDERFMLVYAHHIILDGWCLPVILDDLQKYYTELSAGISTDNLSAEISKEASTETSYAEYVNWIRKQDKTESSAYWRSLLEDYSAAHIFGKENKKNVSNRDIVTFRTSLGEELTRCVERFAREARVSYNTVFEGAFGIALQKYSGSVDVVYNKVISGRSIPVKNIGKTVGAFINTVPVRMKIEKDSTVASLLKETQNQTVEANRHGVLSLAEIYRAGDIDSITIDALFVFENYFTGDVSEIQNGPLSLELISFDEQTEFGLTVTIIKESDGYIIRTSYASDMYTEKEIKDFIRGYIAVIKAFSEQTKLISDIAVTDMNNINSFNETAHTYDIPVDPTLYSFFEKTAKENKEKVCITAADGKLTFGELLGISEKLDVEIRKITKEEKSVVAVIAERSVEMYSAIYGIIRGGNAYLPIDPDYPQERIEYILRNSGARVVVAQGKFAGRVNSIHCIDMTELLGRSIEIEAPLCKAESDDTAYVIYTSGSTGNPKGAKVSHKSAVNRILWMHDKYPLCKEDVILQKTPYTFDVSVWEHFWWGLCGGRLAVSKPGEHFLPAKILEETEKNRVTHLHFVPSVFDIFLNYLETHKEQVCKFNSVKYVFLSGEALASSLVQRFYKLFDHEKVTIHNLYGPTECAVDVTYYDCSPEDCDPVPIGKPIYNTQIYIVDKYMNLAPIGVQGELCVAGMNVGQGYLNNEKLTGEKFIDNPFGGGKLYKTGDLAYWREDGNIIFCGRKDSQVKLNGQRIEISEIEAVIGEVDGVDSVAVIMKKSSPKDMLVAFFTGENCNEEAAIAACVSKLPNYMVPSAFVRLDELPLNKSGKLDRIALNEYKIETAKTVDKEPPANETENYICEVFGNVLGRDDVDRNSNFFDMGGTSLSMISLLSEKGFENIAAAEFMRNPTPAMLSEVMNVKDAISSEYLEPLYVSDKTEKILILLPFAGGGAEAFSALVNSIKKKNKFISVYYVRYLHSFEECKKAADEIAACFKKSEIIFYSHCVGSAIALQIIGELEACGVNVKNYFAGASIPPAKPTIWNVWNSVPDKVLTTILSKAGAQLSNLPQEILTEMLKSFRKDTDFAGVSYCEAEVKIKAPVTVILSKKDIFTKNYRQTEKCWSLYAENIKGIRFIDSKSHYFQSDDAEAFINQLDF